MDRLGTANDVAFTWSTRGQRLTAATGGATTGYSWKVDGDLDTVTPPSGPATVYSHDQAGRREKAATGTTETTWAWDAAGRITARRAGPAGCGTAGTCPTVQARTYDGDGQLNDVSGGVVDDLVWDPVGPQLGQPSQMLEGTVGSGASLTTIRANYGVERLYVDYRNSGSSAIAWYAYDHLGSVIATETMTSAPSAYGPFGENTATATSGFAYRGEFSLAADEVYLRARTYDPTTGTFTSRDPLDGVDGTPTVGHSTHYADNDPLNKVDPLGLRSTDCTYDAADVLDRAIRSARGQSESERREIGGNAAGIRSAAQLEGACLMSFSLSGDGRAVQAFGDLRSARSVVIHIAAAGQDGTGFGDFVDASQRLARAFPGLAAIAWLGYDAPDDGLAALFHHPSPGESRSLMGLVARLKERGKRVSLIGHSHAARVIRDSKGEATANADNAIFVGPWGLMAASAADVPADRSWIGLNDDDWAGVPGLPYTNSDEFIPFATGGSGHSNYFQGEAFENIGRIATGDYACVSSPGSVSKCR